MASPRRVREDRQLGFGFDAPPAPPPPRLVPAPPPPPDDMPDVVVRPAVEPLAPPAGEASTPGEASVEVALRLERNLALFAGAGTGKTHSLVSMCLHALGGVRPSGQPLPASQLCLLTFTDKAAGEMRTRLRRRLAALAQDGDAAREPELARACLELGLPFPPVAVWRRALGELGRATVATFHGLCGHIVRDGQGPAARAELLDEAGSRELLERVVEDVVLRRLEAQDAEVSRLTEAFSFQGNPRALVPELVQVFTALRDDGGTARLLRVTDVAATLARFEAGRARALALARAGARSATRKSKERLARLVPLVEALDAEAGPDDFKAIAAELAHARGEEAEALKELLGGEAYRGEGHLKLLLGSVRVGPLEVAARGLLEEVEAAHRAELERRGQLDFGGLLLEARALLRDDRALRRRVQARIGLLLVDEFQDTNRVQLELVSLLAEERSSGPRPLSEGFESRGSDVLDLPLEPGLLAVVGDRKQAIYEFRGADVSVFEVLAGRLVSQGGVRAHLTSSRRSTPRLLAVFNQVFRRLLEASPTGRQPFEVDYTDEDDLLPHRAGPGPVPLVALEGAPLSDRPTVEEERAADARAVARYLRWYLQTPGHLVEGRDGVPRPVRGGDVAVLFRRFTHVESFRLALVREGVRHRVVRGRGFHGAQEVLDVASFLSVLVDRQDVVSLAAVLRGPLVALRDDALVALVAPGGRLSADVLRPGAPIPGVFTEDEARALQRLRQGVERLSAEQAALGPVAVLEALAFELGLAPALAAGPYGDQALANLDKLLALAREREARGADVAELARELLRLAEAEPTLAQGEVVDELDDEAVTLCTVHQAKGLEWPVVVLPELGARPPTGASRLRFDRLQGLAVELPAEEDSLPGARAHATHQVRLRRQQAESKRLLYVALTRAREQVVLGRLPASPAAESWGAWLRQHALDWTNVAAEVQRVDVEALPAVDASAVEPAPLVDGLPEGLARAGLPPLLERPLLSVPVTQLPALEACPRWFHLAHQALLPQQADRPFAERGEAARAQAQARGTLAHRLLELTPLEAVGTPALSSQLEALCRSLAGAVDGEVVGWVHGFWDSPLGRQVGRLGPGRVHRELPFALELQGPQGRLLARGQVDLLVELDEGPAVLDYKSGLLGSPAHLFQLSVYAAASARLLGHDGPCRAGVVALREDARVEWLPGLVPLEALGERLVPAVPVVARAQASGEWPGRERPVCEALACPYVARCHGAGRGAEAV